MKRLKNPRLCCCIVTATGLLLFLFSFKNLDVPPLNRIVGCLALIITVMFTAPRDRDVIGTHMTDPGCLLVVILAEVVAQVAFLFPASWA